MTKKVRIGSKIYKVYTIGELGKMIDRQPSSIRKMEERGIIPKANFRLPDIEMKNGKIRAGQRIYTDTLTFEIVRIFKNIKQGVRVTDFQKLELKTAFAKELELQKL